MNLEAVLDNWTEYNKRKSMEPGDLELFTCKDWELEYLQKKIKNTFPFINELYILEAIRVSCDKKEPVPRKELVHKVLKKLQMVH